MFITHWGQPRGLLVTPGISRKVALNLGWLPTNTGFNKRHKRFKERTKA